MRRILTFCAASALLVLGLAACGSDSEEESSPTAESSVEQPADDGSASEEPDEAGSEGTGSEDSEVGDSPKGGTSDAKSGEPSESQDDGSDGPSQGSEGDDGDDGDDGSDRHDGSDGSEGNGTAGSTAKGSTSITTLWVDETWSIEDAGEDLCAMGGKTRSPFAEDDDMFVCGPTAAGAEACDIAQGTEVVCITDPLRHAAIRFDSPTAGEDDMDQGDGDLIPLFVTLDDGSADGLTCETISHDHDTHWHDKLSWYRCEDDSELLTDDLIEETFDRGDDGSSWTVQRSVDKKAPKQTPVTQAVFAGN